MLLRNTGLAWQIVYEAFNRYIQSGGDVIDLLSHINHPNRLGHELVAREPSTLVPSAMNPAKES